MRMCVRVQTLLVIAFVFPLGSASVGSTEPENKIGVLTLHGVGSHHEGSAFDARFRKTLQEKAGKKTTIVVKTVYYLGASSSRQAQLWKELDRLEDKVPSSLDHTIIRKLMLASVGDALAYANNPTNKNSFYRSAHEKVRIAVDELRTELGDNRPVVVVANSLGCKVIFDYLCDAQSRHGIWEGKEAPSDFQKLANLRLLITTGCNLPFFESAVPAKQQRFFRVHKDFQWVNFYDRDDVLGWPLRPLGGPFKQLVQDEERNKIGSFLTAHSRYWKNEKLNEEIAARMLEVARPKKPAIKND